MGTRSQARALLDRRIALGQSASISRQEDEHWHYSELHANREFIDMESELRYWRKVYGTPIGGEIMHRIDFEPAVKLGLDAFLRIGDRSFRDLEVELSECYERTRGESRLEWQQARPIVEAVWRKLVGSKPMPRPRHFLPSPLIGIGSSSS